MRMGRLWACGVLAVVAGSGCGKTLFSKDVMYGPHGEIVEMKSPREEMKIKVKGDGTVKIKGARGIGGASRVAPLPVSDKPPEEVGIHGVPVPPPVGHVRPMPGGVERVETTTEEQSVVH